ncbi:MAG: ECF transporter S component [Clostridiales bacterium]|nr:ECF transporter S component [Clostridiales bacterium]
MIYEGNRTVGLVSSAVMGALGFLLMYLHMALGIFPPYLTYDPGDLPPLLLGLFLGPGAGMGAEVIKNVLHLLLAGGTPIGTMANLAAGLTFVGTTAFWWRRRLWGGLPMAMALGVLLTSLVMALLNGFIFLPAWGVPKEAVWTLAKTAIFPFNLVKFTLTSILGGILWTFVKPWLLR